MRAGKLIGIAAAVLGLAVVATVLIMPPVLAVGGQDTKPAPNIVIRQGAIPVIDIPGGGGPRLGVQIRDIEKDELAKLKLPSPNGVAVVEVTKDSAAEKAGVKANDVIVQFDGENVRSTQQLTRLVRETAPARSVKMVVMRDGKRMELDVTPAGPPAPVDVLINRDEMRRDVEREMQALRDQLRQYRNERRLPAPAPPAPLPPGNMRAVPPVDAPARHRRDPAPVQRGIPPVARPPAHARPRPPRRRRAGTDAGPGRLLRRRRRGAGLERGRGAAGREGGTESRRCDHGD